MNKREVQKRVLQNGKPLALNKFEWDSKARVFSTIETGLVLDFKFIDSCTFKTGSGCTFKTGYDCTFKTDSDCTFDTGSHCTFDTGSHCTFDTSFGCTFKTGSDCTFKTDSDCTFKTDSHCTFDTGSHCTFDTSFGCTFKTGSDCTFKTDSHCTFDTGSHCTFDTSFGCTFKTDSDCTFDTGYGCTFNTSYGCTFNTGSDCVIIRRGDFEVIQPSQGDIIQLCPCGIQGYLINGEYKGEPYIIADGILSKIISKKGNVYKVINHNEDQTSYLFEKNGMYAHGKTIKQAKADIIYKISNRDTSKYDNMTPETILTKDECIEMYMIITGACSEGVKYFVEQQESLKDSYSIKDIMKLTKDQYNNNALMKFFSKVN